MLPDCFSLVSQVQECLHLSDPSLWRPSCTCILPYPKVSSPPLSLLVSSSVRSLLSPHTALDICHCTNKTCALAWMMMQSPLRGSQMVRSPLTTNTDATPPPLPPSHTHTHAALLSTLAAAHVRGVFVGHDHGNDWCCPHGTMIVCFGRHTGYGGYGRYMCWTSKMVTGCADYFRTHKVDFLFLLSIIPELPDLQYSACNQWLHHPNLVTAR